MQRGIVKTVEPTSPWVSGENKTMYGFMYTMENGDKGEASHIKNEARFKPGDEVEYECFERSGHPKMKLQKIGNQGGPPKSKKGEFSNAGMAMRFATDIGVAMIKAKPEIADNTETLKTAIKALAQSNLEWLNEN